MIEALFKTLAAAFSIWDTKEKRKYIDELMDLKKDYYEEFNKPMDQRSDAELDDLERKLRILADAFASGVGAPDPKDQP
jgi:hypothetical protein